MSWHIILLILNIQYLSANPESWDTYYKYQELLNSQGLLTLKCLNKNEDTLSEFQRIFHQFTIDTFKKISRFSSFHIVISPYSLWLSLAALAEGASEPARSELFNFLFLPEDECQRKQLYQLALTLEPKSEDVKLERKTYLILDENAQPEANWEDLVSKNTPLKILSAPLKTNAETAAVYIRKSLSLQLPHPNFNGNSILVDTLDFTGLWSTAFSDAVIVKAPFYDDDGKRVGFIDLMTVKMRVRMTYMESFNSKILELPVGFGGRYKMLFSLSLGATKVRTAVPQIMDTVLYDISDSLTESIIPFDVAIPRFRMTSEIDLRTILEEFGVKSVWIDEFYTRNISNPPAAPGSFVHRSTVTLDTTGVKAPIQEISNIVPFENSEQTETGLDPILGKDFIVDRPFLFGLFDTKTFTCLFCAAFSKPTYSDG